MTKKTMTKTTKERAARAKARAARSTAQNVKNGSYIRKRAKQRQDKWTKIAMGERARYDRKKK